MKKVLYCGKALIPQQIHFFLGKHSQRRQSSFHQEAQPTIPLVFISSYFDNDNVLRLLFDSPNLTSAYWPAPWRLAKNVDRSTYNISRTAVLDSYGYFKSSDEFESFAVDYGALRHRRLTVDPDGNARLYSFNEKNHTWEVSWLALSQACRVDGICGPNSMCTYDSVVGRSCYCVPGYKIKNPSDWTQGCEPEFAPPSARSCNHSKFNLGFFRLPNMEFYGYDIAIYPVSSLKECQEICLDLCDNCKGFQIKPNTVGGYDCYPKTLLLNGRDTPNFVGDIYLKLPKSTISSYKKPDKHSKLVCLSRELNKDASSLPLGLKNSLMMSLRRQQGVSVRRLEEEPGGTVYKGKLYDDRIAAIKHLDEAKQGEAEFLAEISTIGRLNHMNLIEMWGYCVHGKHTLLVYEYMEHGSLAENLSSNELDWKKRFNIDVGTAKGLAYLHEECLEWVLHCDVKPQNILLDSSYQPKVADFGLSKLLNRNDQENSNFSRIRGTRGYMAPEWVYNLRITSKVDVYSYGIVVLEMVTGKSPTGILNLGSNGDGEQGRLVIWVNEVATKESWIEEIVNPMMDGKYNIAEVELLVKVAMQCVKDDKDARPTMRQAVEKLLSLEEIE
ncbi:Receptor protein kinase 1-like protein [Quillaja saponaria]|uniref:Receptor protein kinase 1-like protein n=1 Tax=Quillaja saponaria TaxID=32244 RepID=A0AAD7LHU7_QUISA|nr:Receptor protein kinase 1-like protein [Quillaja saponaria]